MRREQILAGVKAVLLASAPPDDELELPPLSLCVHLDGPTLHQLLAERKVIVVSRSMLVEIQKALEENRP